MYLIANRESVPSWCPSIQLFVFGSPRCDFYHRTAYLIIGDIKNKSNKARQRGSRFDLSYYIYKISGLQGKSNTVSLAF